MFVKDFFRHGVHRLRVDIPHLFVRAYQYLLADFINNNFLEKSRKQGDKLYYSNYTAQYTTHKNEDDLVLFKCGMEHSLELF